MKLITSLVVFAGLVALAGCTTMTVTDGDLLVKSVRRVAITHKDTTVIAGQVLINDETVKVLAKEAAQIVDKGN